MKLTLILKLFGLIIYPVYLVGAEKVIQREVMSFQKCLYVIEESSNQLLLSPDILKDINHSKIVIFKLEDGTLKIECDGIQNILLVSVNNH